METAAPTMPEEEGSMNTAAAAEAFEQQESHSTPQQVDNNLIRTSMDDSPEDYGPLKKKHKYRDERDHHTIAATGNGNAGFATSSNTAALHENDASPTLDSSIQLNDAPQQPPAVVDGSGNAASDSVLDAERQQQQQQRDQADAGGDQDHARVGQDAQNDNNHNNNNGEEQEHTANKQQQQQIRDTASSPSSISEKTRKHNFYVPSREVAFLLDSVASEASSSLAHHDLLPYSSTGPSSSSNHPDALNTPANINGGGDGGAFADSAAQSSANALLATGMPITGRQAAKIAAMEAKEKAKALKEKELEEARNRKKMELERKKAEAARKKAEKEAAAAAAAATSQVQANVPQAKARKDSSVSAAAAPVDTAIQPDATVPSKAAPKKRAPARKGSNNKSATTPSAAITKQESPIIPIPASINEQGAVPSTDIKVGSPSSSSIQQPLPPVAGGGQHGSLMSSSVAQPSSSTTTTNIQLPPMPQPEPQDPMTGFLGFIPYASEGARAAALAKAAKQQKAQGNALAGSPASASIPVPVPTVASSGRGSKGANGRKGSSSNNGSPAAMQQLLSAASEGAPLPQTGAGKKGKSSSANNNARTKAQALAAASNNASYSGRASPTNALEHAAAAIDAVLDAGALARAQAQAEEEEEDDRLYCIVSRLPYCSAILLSKGFVADVPSFLVLQCQQLYDPERLMIACDR